MNSTLKLIFGICGGVATALCGGVLLSARTYTDVDDVVSKAIEDSRSEEDLDILKSYEESKKIYDELMSKENETIEAQVQKFVSDNDIVEKIAQAKQEARQTIKTAKDLIDYDNARKAAMDAVQTEIDNYKDSVDYETVVDVTDATIAEAERNYRKQLDALEKSRPSVYSAAARANYEDAKDLLKKSRDEIVETATAKKDEVVKGLDKVKKEAEKSAKEKLKKLDQKIEAQTDAANEIANEKIGKLNETVREKRAEIRENVTNARSELEKASVERFKAHSDAIKVILDRECQLKKDACEGLSGASRAATFFVKHGFNKAGIVLVHAVPVAALAFSIFKVIMGCADTLTQFDVIKGYAA